MKRRTRALVVAGMVSLLLVRVCDDEEAAVEVVAHVKLRERAGTAWMQVPGVAGAERLFGRSSLDLALDRMRAAIRSGREPPDLGRWRRVRLRGTAGEVARALAALERSPDLAAAFVPPVAELATVARPPADGDDESCPVKTPRYDFRQGYLRPAPAGIDAAFAWALPGGRGSAVRFADVEGAWNRAHEDLPGARMEDVGGRHMRSRHWQAHGTAVLGEVAARDNQLGMTGIAPDVAGVVTSSIRDLGTADAIDRAQAALGPGDVLLIELHAIGPRRRFIPVEFWDDVYDAVRIATGRGVVVVAAAGNGGEDLDHPRYRGKLDRAGRDSGAILVGAGAPAEEGFVDRSRLDFSNYGSRLDVQGWGLMVATLDYGDLQGCDADDRKYTALFGGTSSASPVVAGAALLVESVYRVERGCPLDPRALRSILAATGTPQTDGPAGPARQRIGPRPDLARAIGEALAVPCD
ncbi:MAG TPA: S8 family peptidase [Kofleriaceae bacterium]|nr:S8 family peptidase [Kofleriaceae bacterium]